MNLYKKCTEKPYSVLNIEATLASDIPSCFRKNLSQRIWNLIKTIGKKRNEKLQHNIDREAAKIPALSSEKIDKYEYLTGEEILPSKQRQIIEQAKFTYSSLGKAFEKQLKTIEDPREKQIKALEDHVKQLNLVVKKNLEHI